MSDGEDKTTVTVTIGGEEYALRADASPDYTRECADYLDRALDRILERGSLVEVHKGAILAALSITDELFQARAETEALRREFARLSGELAADIERTQAADELASRP